MVPVILLHNFEIVHKDIDSVDVKKKNSTQIGNKPPDVSTPDLSPQGRGLESSSESSSLGAGTRVLFRGWDSSRESKH